MKEVFIAFLLSSVLATSQEVIVGAGASITLGNATSFNIKGLELLPSTEFVISGNSITRSTNPVIGAGGNESVPLVFTNLVVLNSFVGTITFYYDDSDLNGIDESKLVLEVKDEFDVWQNYEPIRNGIENTLTYTFHNSIKFLGVTASSEDATLPVEEFENELGITSIYPNPAVSEITISSSKELRAELYSMLGVKVLESSKEIIDISYLTPAVYLLKLTDDLTNTSKIYKIVKK